jgi:hypothetical protein
VTSFQDLAMTREELEKVRTWANDKIATGAEPPWAWYQYMKLRETLDAILNGMDATVSVTLPADSLPEGQRPEAVTFDWLIHVGQIPLHAIKLMGR